MHDQCGMQRWMKAQVEDKLFLYLTLEYRYMPHNQEIHTAKFETSNNAQVNPSEET
jgi:hypothetical protein